MARVLKDVREIGVTHLSMEESLALARVKYSLAHDEPIRLSPAMRDKILPHLSEEDRARALDTTPVVAASGNGIRSE